MNFEDGSSSLRIYAFFKSYLKHYLCLQYLDVRSRDVNLPVESARSEKGVVKDVKSVGGSKNDNIGLPCVESIHFD